MAAGMFQRFPVVHVDTNETVAVGWDAIGRRLRGAVAAIPSGKKVIVAEYYQGVFADTVTRVLREELHPDVLIDVSDLYRSADEIETLVHPDVTDDRLFGRLTRLTLLEYFDPERLRRARREIVDRSEGTVLCVGTGAAIVAESCDLLFYADMARWEIQLRMRAHEVDNIGVRNRDADDWMLLYKQGYFVDWRVCDSLKRTLLHRLDFLLDTNDRGTPKLVRGEAVREGLRQAARRPFSVVPFFDPGPWGGQWMKKVCGLDPAVSNYAWCFNCVPEENSLLLGFGGTTIELPSIDLVFFEPRGLLGDAVYARFGDEFPIRFDFLDTMEGGNLSLQVHPLTEYIREQFGIPYTQDESYYVMDAAQGAVVYLGLKDGVDGEAMLRALEEAQAGGAPFDAERYVQTWPVHKHDHFLIPSGTVHCSGKDSVVLEISATPYIFTFKLWDWGRLGLDGKPRPINIGHGRKVIQWERTTSWAARDRGQWERLAGRTNGAARAGVH
jgi:hypothetical protein